MSFIVGNTYPARIDAARFIASGEKGTPGVEITFNCGDSGSITDTVYITPGGIEITRKQLNALGATDEQLESDDFFEKIGEWIGGANCSIVIGEDEYKGKKKLIVKFINSAQKAGGPELARQAASLFRSTNPATVNAKYAGAARGPGYGPPSGDWQPSDADVPASHKRY